MKLTTKKEQQEVENQKEIIAWLLYVLATTHKLNIDVTCERSEFSAYWRETERWRDYDLHILGSKFPIANKRSRERLECFLQQRGMVENKKNGKKKTPKPS